MIPMPIMPLAGDPLPDTVADPMTQPGARGPGHDALITLHTRTLDALAGYETMADKAEPEFRPVVEEFRAIHATHSAVLSDLLAGLGHAPEGDGSLMGTVNKSVVTMRSWFDDIDQGVLGAIHDGEQRVLTAFDDALAEALDPTLRDTVLAMRGELTALLARHPA